MRGASGLWLALLGLALGPAAPPAALGSESSIDLIEFMEFLGDEDIAGAAWKGFFAVLPEPTDDRGQISADPPVTEEAPP